VAAGEPGYQRAVDAFVAETDRLRRSPALRPAVRRKLIGQLERFDDFSRTFIRRIEVDDDGGYEVDRERVEFPDAALRRAVANLKGLEPDDAAR
jgi:hypothetical protein